MTTRIPTGETGADLLDTPRLYATLDPTKLGERLGGLPSQCKAAWNKARAATLPRLQKPIDKVVIGGMGGSAIAGDLVMDLVATMNPAHLVPMIVPRGFQMPFTLDRSSLVILCSHSGNTQETLSLLDQAVGTDAQVIAIAGGGLLAEGAKQHRSPLLTTDLVGEPRHTVGFNLMLLLGVLDHFGLVRVPNTAVSESIAALQQQVSRLGPQVPTRDNPAKQLAHELVDRLVVVYGGGLFAGLARRWKTQLNENAKAWAFFEVIPELLHNSVETYGSRPQMKKQAMFLLLRPKTSTPWLDERFRVLTDLLQQSAASHRVLTATEGPPLAQLLAMILLGDHVSYYLALLQGVNPSPTPYIDQTKEQLAHPLIAPEE